MTDIFNFHDTFYVVTSNWFWMLVALGLGIWFGWATSAPDKN